MNKLLSLIFVFCALLSVVLTFELETEVDDDYHYGVMLDAGSSSTKTFVYKWNKPAKKDIAIVQVLNAAIVRKTSPGLATYYNNIAGIKSHFAPQIDYARTLLTNNETAFIYLKGTAGMRLLSDADQAAVLAESRKVLNETSGFIFKDARVIAGSDEGYLAWTTANYLNNTLASGETFGSLELGGASVQIAFAPEAPADGNVQVIAGNRTFSIYTTSLLGLGKDEAIKSYKSFLAGQANDTTIDNYCYHSGHDVNVTVSDSLTVQLLGAGNYEKCRESFSEFIKQKTEGLVIPPIKGKFYAIAAFAFTAQFYNIVKYPAPNSAKDFDTSAVAFCATDFDDAKAQYPTVDVGFLGDYCISSALVSTLLTDVFKFNQTDESLLITTKLSNFDLGYQLGAMLQEAELAYVDPQASQKASQKKSKSSAPSTHSLSNLLVGIVMVVLLALLA